MNVTDLIAELQALVALEPYRASQSVVLVATVTDDGGSQWEEWWDVERVGWDGHFLFVFGER